MKKSLAFHFGCVVGAIISLSVVRADDAKVEFFEKKIRPLLVLHCYECHSKQSKKLGGELLLDHRQGILQGGESGAAIEPGNPEKSLLIRAVRYEDEALRMPPKGKLPAESLADLEAWIKMGAPDPRDSPENTRTSTNTSWEETFRTRRDWWSLRPVNRPPVPVPQDADWSQEPVDRFIRVGLEAKGLRPGRPADAETLARRLSLVLTGLPATVEVINAFAAAVADSPAGGASSSPPADPVLREKSTDRSRQAIEALVDQLLNSPHFGERWARHWMDVVRFSETHGNEWNYEVHHAWRYRDYLIRAFNDDIPYDQFVREHIAGDLLPAPRWNKNENWNESVVATCFYRFGEVNHDDCISLRQIGYDLADNQIDTLAKAFQATTVACARCHDHKLDAISMRDYYALLGVLRSSRLVSHTIDAPDANASLVERLRQLKRELNSELADLWMQDARQLAGYMQAAQARRAKQDSAMDLASGLDPQRLEKWVAVLAAEKVPLDDPLEPWRAAASDPTDAAAFSEHWRKVAQRFVAEDQRRIEFNEREFATWADFRGMQPADWQIGGQGLRSGPSRSGELALHPEGNLLVKTVLPAGWFTHGLSEKLNGTLRSPVLPPGKKRVSFQVIGQRSSAVRLVSNHCQLNYKNYRALTSPEWTWVTFDPPDEREQLRTYAELMTMFDNPKFPDQLSALGGDKDNYKLPWEKAAENPRSYFGITRVVVHDCAEPPQAELDHLRPLFDDSAPLQPASLADVTLRYAALVETAIQNWASGRATDRDIRWLDALLRRGLLSNDITSSPRVSSLTQEYRQTETKLSLPRVAAGIADEGPGIEQPVFTRGDCLRPGDVVQRRYLEAISGANAEFISRGSGRLELAEIIASPQNPLTARVMVNRVWHHLFGTGLVRTVDDFGHVGEPPSHPELLDYLASEFVQDHWSVKRLIRRLVLTRTFQLTNQPSAAANELDPQNRYLSHYPARRMEAEAIRDSILAASGRLERMLFGMSVQPYREKEYADRRLFPGPLDGDGRRSIYIKNNLMESPKFLSAFNIPGGKVTQGRRDVTNVPAQALALLNDPFVHQQADVWAQRLVVRSGDSIAARIDFIFRTALNRRPSDMERLRFELAATQFGALHQVPPSDVLHSHIVWKDIAHAIFNLQEFIFIP